MTPQNELAAYMAQLNPLEQKVLQIAASHLETSFSLMKSIGFLEWQAQQPKQAPKQAQQPKQAHEQTPQPKQAHEQTPQKIKVKKKLTPRVV